MRYRAELESPERLALLQDLAKESREGTVTLVFAAKDEARNEAAVLRDVIAEMGSNRRRAAR